MRKVNYDSDRIWLTASIQCCQPLFSYTDMKLSCYEYHYYFKLRKRARLFWIVILQSDGILECYSSVCNFVNWP